MQSPAATPVTDVPQRILIVDDDESVLATLGDTVRDEGYEVVTALDAMQALDQVRQRAFAVIISDQKMPRMSGLEFLDQAKRLQPNTTRILLTGVVELNTVIEAINKGEIYRFMVKPWLREELLVTLKNAVQRCQLICQNETLQAATHAMNQELIGLNRSLEEKAACVAEQNKQLEQLNLALEQNLQRSVELCLKTMQTFYPTLGGQARRVFAICCAMADALRLAPEQRQILEISAWLHDVGLLGISRDLIRRWKDEPEQLSQAEQALIKQHPVMGQELVSFVHHLKAVGATIRAHHERFDGRGYPDGLKGEEIPWLGRLLGVAVGYAESKYEGREAALSIELNRETAYDPEAVRVFLRSLPQAVIPRKDKEVLFSELRPGMVLASGIYNASGMLLIPEGQQLNPAAINKLEAHNRVSPINQSLQVYV